MSRGQHYVAKIKGILVNSLAAQYTVLPVRIKRHSQLEESSMGYHALRGEAGDPVEVNVFTESIAPL